MQDGSRSGEGITGKGTSLTAAMAFVEERFGRDGVERLKTELAEDHPNVSKGIILASSRYPLRDLVGVFEGIDRVFGRGDFDLCFELGRFTADYQVKLAHKVFLKVGKLDYWFKLTGSTWRSYYSAGTMTPFLESESGSLTLSEFDPISKAFCLRFSGWATRIVEMSGLSNIDVRHPECVLDGAPACVWKATWKK